MPADIVNDFISAIERGDMDHALTFLSADVEYDNVPLGKVQGPDAVRAILGPFRANFDEVQWIVTHQATSGDADSGVVMNERIDRARKGDHWAEIALAGLFVIRHGKIVLWRDYFDQAQFERAYRS